METKFMLGVQELISRLKVIVTTTTKDFIYTLDYNT